jgi:hypothetical protein
MRAKAEKCLQLSTSLPFGLASETMRRLSEEYSELASKLEPKDGEADAPEIAPPQKEEKPAGRRRRRGVRNRTVRRR